MAENELPDQVLVEIGGNYELVDRKNLITPESVDLSSKEEKEDEEEETGRGSPADPLTSTSDGERSSELSSPKQEVTPVTSPSPTQATAPMRVTSPSPAQTTAPPRVTSPSPAQTTAPPRVTSPSPAQATAPLRVTSPVTARVISPVSHDQSSRPASVQSLRSSSQPLLHSKHYKQFERTTTPNRQSKRPMSARPASNNLRKKQHQLDAEAIQRREMADAAFEHWKKQKDKELLKKKREAQKKEEKKDVNKEQEPARSGPFDAWLENKTRQRAEQRQREKLRAQIITSELLSVDYSESELAYERWLKQKNQSRRAESREKIRKRQEDKEEMKTVLHNIKTRWRIDYNKSRYLHPNTIRGWDDTPVYSNGPPLFPW